MSKTVAARIKMRHTVPVIGIIAPWRCKQTVTMTAIKIRGIISENPILEEEYE